MSPSRVSLPIMLLGVFVFDVTELRHAPHGDIFRQDRGAECNRVRASVINCKPNNHESPLA